MWTDEQFKKAAAERDMDAEELGLVSQQSEGQKKKSCLDRALETAHDIGETIIDLFIGD